MGLAHKYICIHGHFYQPPRENAWLEVVEQQDSAMPFHDWNERINFECYAANAAARIMDGDGKIAKIYNNYSRISFNFGPTLLSWMKDADPKTLHNIVKADQESRERFSGHGNAIAQVHSHLILPLCNEKDKQTQVIWGIKDFEQRFGRQPEGIWLSECAVDTPSLEVLAANNIKYTILAPRQAKAVRKIGDDKWHELDHAAVDPRRPYWCHLPSGKKIALFFYDGGIAQGVAFDGLLNNGKAFANRFAHVFDHSEEPQLAHIATDGESYGHHHKMGEMALADCLSHLEEHGEARLTNYGEFLEKHPPTWEVEIHENSSWSCAHGVERWRSDCGCKADTGNGWNQEWRTHLRNAFDWLRQKLVPIFEEEAGLYLKDVWAARNDYIHVINNRTTHTFESFIKKHKKDGVQLGEKDIIRINRLMEMQRQAMQMYTSCGWFFDEISGIETNQILQYALRAMHYAAQLTENNFKAEFMALLDKAHSNLPHEYPKGSDSFKKNVLPAQVDLYRVGMHYAVASLFTKRKEKHELFNYRATDEHFERYVAGNQRLVIGRTTINSKITQSNKYFSFVALYIGQLNIIGYISKKMDRETYDAMQLSLSNSFNSANLGECLGLMQDYFGENQFTIWHLFRDEKQKVLNQITAKRLQRVNQSFRKIYNDNFQLMNGILRSNVHVPMAYLDAAQHVLNYDLLHYFNDEELEEKKIATLVGAFKKWNVELTNTNKLKLVCSERIHREIIKLTNGPSCAELQVLNHNLKALKDLNVNMDLWKSQNLYFQLLHQFKAGQLAIDGENQCKSAIFELGAFLNVATT